MNLITVYFETCFSNFIVNIYQLYFNHPYEKSFYYSYLQVSYNVVPVHMIWLSKT